MKDRTYYIRVNGKSVPVSRKIYKTYHKMGRRERYLEEADEDKNVMSYNALDNNDRTGEEIISETDVDSVADSAISSLMIDKLRSVVSSLPMEDQELLRLLYWEGLSHSQIAVKMNMPKSSVTWRLDKLLKILKKHL